MARVPAVVTSYEAKDTKVYKGILGVRRKPSMYLGGNDSRAINHMFLEVVGNSNDEAQNGHGKRVQVHFARSGFVTVKDEGRGIPVGAHPDYPTEDTMYLLLTEMHAGGKFHEEGETSTGYETSLGTHGVGISVVNAVSASLEVWSWRNRTWNYLRFQGGVPVGGKTKPVPVKQLPADLGLKNVNNVGTIVRYKPDLGVFARGSRLEPALAVAWLDNVSWLVGDVRYEISIEGRGSKVIHRPNGLRERFDMELQKAGVDPLGEPFIYHDKNLDVLIGWSSHTDEIVHSAVSAATTREGGTHVSGLNAAISQAFAAIAGKIEYKNDYLRTGMIAVVNVKIAEPSFNSQDKVKLVSDGVKDMIVAKLVGVKGAGALSAWLGKNKALARLVLERAEQFTALHADFKASKQLAAAFKTEVKGRIMLPKGLKAALTDDDNEREVYLVEGGSAGGCLDGETLVLLADGTTKTFEQLVADETAGTKNYGLAYNPTTGQPEPFEMDTPRITKMAGELIELELSDGNKVRCTPCHPWLLTDGSYKPASELTEADELQEIQQLQGQPTT